MKRKDRILIPAIILIAVSYNSIYSLAYMKGLYYSMVKSGLHLTHFQLGQLYSAFGLFSMFSYLCGAFFISHFQHRILLFASSLSTGLLTLYLASLPPYPLMLATFGIIGFLIGSTFYPAHLELLHQLGGVDHQGYVFSTFFVANGVSGIVSAVIGLLITSLDFNNTDKTRLLLYFFSALNITCAVLVLLFLKKTSEHEVKSSSYSKESLRQLLTNTRLWLVILLVFANYLGCCCLNYFIPYVDSNFSMPAQALGLLKIVCVYLIFIIAAPIGGKLTDHLRSAPKVLLYSFLLTTLTLTILVLCFRNNLFGTVFCIISTYFFCYIGKSMALITIDGAGLPLKLYGMAVSLVSFLSYSPDSFFYSASGIILDKNPDNGYIIIFVITIFILLLGAVASAKLSRSTRFWHISQ